MTSTAVAGALRWFPAPTVTSVTTNTGPQAGGANVTIAGSGFTGATGIMFNSSFATNFVLVSDVSITCTTPAHGAGAVNVYAVGPGYNASGVLIGGYTYV